MSLSPAGLICAAIRRKPCLHVPNYAQSHGTRQSPKKLSKRAQHLPPSGVLTNRGQDVAHLVQTRGSYLNGTIKVKGSESSCDD